MQKKSTLDNKGICGYARSKSGSVRLQMLHILDKVGKTEKSSVQRVQDTNETPERFRVQILGGIK